MNSLVSVIIPTHNRKEYVVKAINSVLRQTYKNVEIIVIDDASTDGTEKVMLALCQAHQEIVFIKNDVNLGFVKNLNKAIDISKGKYIARLDDDDFWNDENKLELQINFLENNLEYALVGGGVIKIGKDGKEIIRFLVPESDEDIRKSLLLSNDFAHSSVVFKKADWQKVEKYDEKFGFFADWDLWLKLGTLGKFYNFQKFFISYLDQEQNLKRTSHDYLIRRKLITNIKLKNKYKKYYPGYIKAVFISFANYFYSFMPFRSALWPIIFRIRPLIFGQTPYKYFK